MYLQNFKGYLLVSLFFLISSCQCQRKPEVHAIEGRTMGTTYSVKYVKTGERIVSLQQDVDLLLERVNDSMSTYRPKSEISNFNNAAAFEWFSISQDMQRVTKSAREIFEKSEGWFDPTVGPAVNLWGFGPNGPQKKPSDLDVKKTMEGIGFDMLELDEKSAKIQKKHANMYLDYSALAKGYGVDLVAELLMAKGISSYLVEIGGEIRVRGAKPDAVPWSVGIEAPDREQRRIQKVVHLNDIAMATSGDYRNFFEQDGIYYSHTINPKTGMPVRHELGGVSVFAGTCMEADAWATALMSMGPELGYLTAQKHGLKAYFLYTENGEIKARWTDGVDAYFKAK